MSDLHPILSPLDLFPEQFRLKYMIDAERCRRNRQFSCQPAQKPHDGRFFVEVDAQCDLPVAFVHAIRVKEYFCDVSLAERVRRGFLYGGGIQIQIAGIVGCGRCDHHRRCAHIHRVGRHRPWTCCRVYISVWVSHLKARVCDRTSAKLYVAGRGPAKPSAALPMTSGARSLESYASRYLQCEQRDPLRAETRSVECLTGNRNDSQHGQHKLDRSGNFGQRLSSTTAPYQFGFSFVVRYRCPIEDQVQASSRLPSQPQQATRYLLCRKNTTPQETGFCVDGVAQLASTRFRHRLFQ